MDKATYEKALNTLLALEACVNKALMELEKIELEESFKQAA